MKKYFTHASKSSYQIGMIVCIIHLLVSWWVIINIARSQPDAQWQLIWVFFLPFDFPFSLLVLFSGSIFPVGSIKGLPYPIGEFNSFILPVIIHGIIGPLWYFTLPVLISHIVGLVRRKQNVKHE